MKKTLIIGLGPEYNYPKNFDLWQKNDTKYASNHGASLISRALAKQFNADFIDINEFHKVEEYNKTYNQCIIAFATHVTTWRDVSIYTDFVDKLKIPTFAFSLGVQDYSETLSSFLKIHPSLKRLLDIISDRSKLIGVRGHYTASILYKNGYKNVVPIGCPTIYWNLNRNLKIKKPSKFNKPAIVFHRTMAGKEGQHLIKNTPLIGQDFLDEAIFTNNLKDDTKIVSSEINAYRKQGFQKETFDLISKNGIFHYSFQEWFDYLKTKDFILGPRLHGCIGSLIQGIPAVMLARDRRVEEIAQFFNIPYINYVELEKKSSIQQIFDEADFNLFNKTYKLRYDNYVNFLHENSIESCLEQKTENDSILYSYEDVRTLNYILNQDIQDIKLELDKFKQALKTADALYKGLAKIPLIKKIGKSFD